MKRIIPFSLYLLLVSPSGLFAKNAIYSLKRIPIPVPIAGSSKSLVLRGSLSNFNAAYGKNYFELNWNTVAGNFDHFEIERSLDGVKFETIGTVETRLLKRRPV